MTKICFETKIYEINSWRILRLPNQSSEELTSRGMVLVKGIINNIDFEAALEPDGMGSHWFRVSDSLSNTAQVEVGDMVSVMMEPLNSWFEPEIPSDLKNALDANKLLNTWSKITVKSRWEWIRWIRFTNNPATRQKRIEVACSMLESGKKRPCCFDHSRCTETHVSKNGKLLAVE